MHASGAALRCCSFLDHVNESSSTATAGNLLVNILWAPDQSCETARMACVLCADASESDGQLTSAVWNVNESISTLAHFGMGGAPPLPPSLSLSLSLSNSTSHWRVASRETIALYPNTPASNAGESSGVRILKAGTFVCHSASLVYSFSLFSFPVAHRCLLTRPSCCADVRGLRIKLDLLSRTVCMWRGFNQRRWSG